MKRRRVEDRLEDLRNQITDDLAALRQDLGRKVPRVMREPFGDLGRDATRLLRVYPAWLAGAVAGAVVGVVIAFRRRRSA